jgi:hypothetical protein
MIEKEHITLHEAMRRILLSKTGHTSTFHQISIDNRHGGLYRRKKDRQFPGAHQIRARANQYKGLFESLGGGRVRLKT